MMEENKVRERSNRLTKELVKRGLVEPLDMVVQLVEEAIFRELVLVRDATIKKVLVYEADVAAYESYCVGRGERP